MEQEVARKQAVLVELQQEIEKKKEVVDCLRIHSKVLKSLEDRDHSDVVSNLDRIAKVLGIFGSYRHQLKKE